MRKQGVLWLGGFLLLVLCSISGCQAIVGGYDRNISEVPFTASIVIQAGAEPNEDYYMMCGGSFLNTLWVLTDFECIRKTGTDLKDREPIDLEKIRVGFGHTDRHDIITGFLMRVHKVVVNKEYPHVALLKLNRNVSFSDGTNFNFTHSAPYFLDAITVADSPPAPGDYVEVSGWGAVNKNGFEVTPALQSINGTLNNNTDCDLSEQSELLCFGSRNPIRDACSTDQGAPLVNAFGQQVGFYIESSGGSLGDVFCTGRGVYQRLDLVAPWIANTTADLTFTDAASPLLSFSLLSLFIVFFVFHFIC